MPAVTSLAWAPNPHQNKRTGPHKGANHENSCGVERDLHRRADGLGGAEGIRTPDLRIANATLSQLSYGPSDGTVWHVTGKVSNAGLPPPCILPEPENVNRV